MDKLLCHLRKTVPVKIDQPDKQIPRMQWSSHKDFVIALICLTIGLGNYWHFPVLLCNAEGIFIIPYTIAAFLIGIPVTYMELSVGQFSEKGPLGIWVMCPLAKGIGIALFIYLCYLVVVYAMILSYCLYFFFSSITPELPWSRCDPSWSDYNCVTREQNTSKMTECLAKRDHVPCIKANWQQTEDHFWMRRVLGSSPIPLADGLGRIKWDLALCVLLVFVLVCGAVSLGTKSIEKVSPLLMWYSFLGLIVMLFVTFFDKGVGRGLKFLFNPKFELLLEPQIWIMAMEQVFYSLSLGTGALIFYGSYCPFRSPTNMDAIIVNLLDVAVSVLNAFLIVNCLGAIGYVHNISVSDITATGSSVIFVKIPEAMLHLNGPPSLLSAIMFSTIFTAGLSSEYSLVFVCLGVFYDWHPTLMKYKIQCSIIVCSLFYMATLVFATESGPYLLDMLHSYLCGPVMLIILGFEFLTIFWLYGVKRLSDDLHFMHGFRVNAFWQVCWFCLPVIVVAQLTVVLFTWNKFLLPTLYTIICWVLSALPPVFIIIVAIFNIIKYKRKNKALQVLQPEETWGPVNPILMKSRRMFSSQAMTKEYMYRQARLKALEKFRHPQRSEMKL